MTEQYDWKSMRMKSRVHEAADWQRLFPTWCEPQVFDEDHLERSRIVTAFLNNDGQKSGTGRHTDAAGDSVPDNVTSLTEDEFWWAVKNMRPARKTEHKMMCLSSMEIRK